MDSSMLSWVEFGDCLSVPLWMPLLAGDPMNQQTTPSRGSPTAAEVFTAIGLAVAIFLAIISVIASCSQIVNFVRPGSTPNSSTLLVAFVALGASGTVTV